MALTKLCPGCKKEYQSGRPYGKHLSACKSLETVTQQAVKNRASSKVKRARIRKGKAREMEAEAITGTEMDIDSNGGIEHVADRAGSMSLPPFMIYSRHFPKG
ncbi:hypothetical protein CPC08DRAFT_727120 [Agrocybe pediades]|nr:hypothetical protein CPC08DRAFT_727120 [Agrocybe pediades]